MTSEEFLLLVKDYIRKRQGPRAMSELADALSRMSDPQARDAAQVAMSVATAQQSDDARLIELLTGVDTFISTTTAGGINFGTETLTFAGSISEESITETVTGQTWFVDFETTPVFTFYIDGARTSDVLAYNFLISVGSPAAGDGWDITLTTPSTGGVQAGDYIARWFGLG